MATMKKLPHPIPNPGYGVAAIEGYLDKVAVAKRLGLRPRTVGEWAKQGKLPAYRVGACLRFKWAEVENYLDDTCRVCRQSLQTFHKHNRKQKRKSACTE